jgi:O-antigen ligase
VTGTPTTPTNGISTILLFVVVAAAPLPFGSAEPPAIAFWCIVLGIAAVTASPRGLRRQHIPLVVLAALVTFGYALVLHEQLAARPWIGKPHPLWSKAAQVLGEPIAPSVSIARNQPFFALGAPLANMLALICSFLVCINPQRARQLVVVIAWSGVGYALYGIATYLADPAHLLWREKIAYRDVLTSTFINRNTAAVYFGSCAVLWLLLLSKQIRRRLPLGPLYWRSVPPMFLSEGAGSIVAPFAMLLLCVTAMLMTNSRSGTVMSLAALIIAFAMYFRRYLSGRKLLVTLPISVVVVLVLLQVLGGNISGRFDFEGLSDGGRFETYRSTLKMIADHPLFGTGLGTFVWSYPEYRSADLSTWGVWDRAHSTPLELATDLGLPLATLIIVAWLVVLGILIRAIFTRRRNLVVLVGAFAVASLALAHSCIDFSLQISGYSIIVFALVGAALSQSWSSKRVEAGVRNTRDTPSGLDYS